MNPFVDVARVAKLRAEVEEPAQQHGQATDHRKDGKTEANHDRIEVDRHDVEHLRLSDVPIADDPLCRVRAQDAGGQNAAD